MTQREIRLQKREARRTLSDAQKQCYSEQITKRVIESRDFQQAQSISVYLALPEEVNLNAIVEQAWADGKAVYLPVVIEKGQSMLFAPYTKKSRLIKDVMNIPIPDVASENFILAHELDTVITPLVAFDENCNRIGMGGGFYDRTFAFRKSRDFTIDNILPKGHLIGVAFEAQRVEHNIIAQPWDISPDAIMTEASIYFNAEKD